ncbi:MAG TPA: cytochrome b N-terminal domain-containing protein [Isosphaeraceae bacterium]|nr:cytochrome b N-terminal domain-containing protein [Isosphaeraceae bacterium]
MLKPLADWLEARTGYRALLHEALDEPVPGGARWRYVWGSALTGTFLIQLFTGTLLMFSYSPSSSTAWGSVFYINDQMRLGWFIRGIHHFGSQAMIVLLALHIVQVLLAGAYRSPREINWWFGVALMFLTVGFSLTGYLLPWDQKGYWATKVATNIAGSAPGIGPALQRVVVGGLEYGNQTLTRFYGLHVGVLPTLLVFCLVAHVALFRKHGVTAPRNAQGMDTFWPKQVFFDTLASAAVFGVLVGLVLFNKGAPLDAPADPSSGDYPARPEWYFLSLFQMLKYFPGEREVIGTVVVPGAIMTVLLLLPLLDKILPGRLAHFLACAFVFTLFGAVGFLTFEALKTDAADMQFQASRVKADAARQRAVLLAADPNVGIPPDGPAYILLRDPLTHGRAVLESKCLSCHYYDGKGIASTDASGKTTMNLQTASDLKGFGSLSWIKRLLEDPTSSSCFGKVPQCDGMAEWKKDSKLSKVQLDEVAAFVAAFSKIPADVTPQEWAGGIDPAKTRALEPFVKECGQCHLLGDTGLTQGGLREAPDLFAYGSPQWIKRMIRKPGAPDKYAHLEKKDQMPSFADQLSDNDLETLVRYLRGNYVGAAADSSHSAAERPVAHRD